MSDQRENENQQSLTPEEVRQSLLAEIDATQQAIAELSNEQLEEVVGGGWLSKITQCFTCGKPQPASPAEPSVHAASSSRGRGLSAGIHDSYAAIDKMLTRPEGGGRSIFRTLSAPGKLEGH